MEMMPDTLTIGLIGAGRIGRVHAANLAYRIPAARVLAVADVNEAAAQDCAQQFGIPSVYADYRKILEDREIQAVAICSATDTHADLIEAAAEAGKHIFCEKPIALNLE